MNYRVTYDTSANKYESTRMYVPATATSLARKISQLQAKGYVIYSVTQH